MDKRVAVKRCESYENGEINAAVSAVIDSLGGIDQFVKPGMKVLIKPNLIMGKHPDTHATTHPSVIEAVVNIAQFAGGEVTIADSPGGPYNERALKHVYDRCGISEIANRTGCRLNYNTAFSDVANNNAKLVKSFPVIDPVTKADVIINLCKLKTHMMAGYSGAVKNMFGALPGTYKAEYHFRLSDPNQFCAMLVDLCDTVMPALSIMDGVFGMEGDGPTNGTPKKMDFIMGAANPYALDLAAVKIIDTQPGEVKTVDIAIERGYIPSSAAELEITGDGIDAFVRTDYKKVLVKDSIDFTGRLPKFLRRGAGRFIEAYARPYPVYLPEKCIKCRRCIENCPAKCLGMGDGAPALYKEECIRCFCCHELCPADAVRIKTPALLSFIHRITTGR